MTPETIGRAIGIVVQRWRVPVIVACILSFALLSFGITRTSFSTDYTIFFADDDPKRQAFERIEKVFSKTDNVVFVVKADTGDVFNTHVLGAIQELTDAAWKLPHASRVDSLTNFQHSYADGDDIVVEDLVFSPAKKFSDDELDAIRQTAMKHPLLVGGLLASDGLAAGVNVTLRLSGENPGDVTETVRAARALASAVQEHHGGIEIRTSGMALMNDAFMEASLDDMSFIFPLMCVVMVAAMLMTLRSILATVGIVAVVIFSSGVTLGTAGWLGYPLTPPSAAAPTIVLTLAIADGVHLFFAMREGVRKGLTQHEAIVQALQTNFRPVLLTSVTTMIGFACLNAAEAAPYWHLANMTVVGIGAALVYSLTFLPAIMSLGVIRADHGRRDASHLLRPLAERVIRYRRTVLVAAAAVTVVLGSFAARLEIDDRFLDYFDDSIAFRPDAEYVLEHLGGLYTMDFQLDADEAVSDPDYLVHLDSFGDWLRNQSEVVHVYSVADIVKRLNMNTHADVEEHYRIAATRAANGQLLMLYEMALPFGLDMTDRVDIGKTSSRLTVTVRDLSSRELRIFASRAEQWLRSNAPKSMWAEAVSPVVIFSHLSVRNAKSMMTGNVISVVLITGCLMVALASVRLGLLSIIPNVLPIFLGFGLWALLFREIDIVASVAGTVCLGIIVDDTIHFLTKYRLARRRDGLSKDEAVRHAFSSVGPALIATTGILMVGFGVLTQSGFQMNTHLGLMVVIVVALALIADLLLLPALLLVIDRDDVGGVGKEP